MRSQWKARGYDLTMGIGIAQGVATIGAIGFEGRRDYGAIGGVTNLAARLCGEAAGGQILVSEVVARETQTTTSLRSVGELTLKGFAHPQAAFEVAEGGTAVSAREQPTQAGDQVTARTASQCRLDGL